MVAKNPCAPVISHVSTYLSLRVVTYRSPLDFDPQQFVMIGKRDEAVVSVYFARD